MSKSDANLLTQAEYARSRKARGLPGGSREAIRKAVEANRISSFGPDKLVDQQLADAQWERNTRARVCTPGDVGVSEQVSIDQVIDLPLSHADNQTSAAKPLADPGYMEYRIRSERANAEEKEINVAKLRGAMVMRQDVDRGMFEGSREIRDHLTASARRIAAEVASLTSAEACESIIDREHRIVLELLVTAFREMIGAPIRETGK